MIRKSCFLLVILFLCMFISGGQVRVHAASKTRRKTLVVGETKQLKARNVSGYKSNKPSVAKVSSSGLVTARKKGTCRITAVRGKKKLIWKIKVVNPKLNKNKKSLKAGSSFLLRLKKASGLKYSWTVSDKSVLKLKKVGKNKYKVKGLKSGTATVKVTRGSFKVTCKVTVKGKKSGSTKGIKTSSSTKKSSSSGSKKSTASSSKKSADSGSKKSADSGSKKSTASSSKKSSDSGSKKSTDSGSKKSDTKSDTGKDIQTLYLDGNVFKQMTWNRSDVGKYISSLSSYGQSAPLYIHKDGGDGLENIWAETNNGAVGVEGAQLSDKAVSGTILKACYWARAIADSPYHGYDYGHSYEGANLMYAFGQAKPNGLGTGDYCCSTIPLCAYYFAGVNVIGENLGGSDAKYIPNSTKLFYEGSWGEITYYKNGKLTGSRYLSNYEWKIFRFCGFKDVVKQYKKNKDGFVFKAGDIVTANGHTQMILSDGTRKNAETVQAYGPDKVKSGKMPKGGDQGYEIGRAYGVRTSLPIKHIMRFTGKGVKLNTVGLVD